MFFRRKHRKKWKHIKDAYFRTVKENKPKSGDGMTKKRKKNYIYHDQMQFFTKTIIPRKTISSIPEQGSEEYVQLQPSTSEINLPAQVQNNEELEKKPRNVEDTFMEYLEEMTKQNKDQKMNNSNPVEKDEHENFFDTMLLVVRQFDVDQTLAFRAKMINVILKIKRGTNVQCILQFNFNLPNMNKFSIITVTTMVQHKGFRLLYHRCRAAVKIRHCLKFNKINVMNQINML